MELLLLRMLLMPPRIVPTDIKFGVMTGIRGEELGEDGETQQLFIK